VNKYYFLLMGIYLSCGLVMAQENMSYQELDAIVWSNYSQITQLEYEGFCHLSSYQVDTKTWKYGEFHDIYGFSNNSAYYAANPRYGNIVDSLYITDKNKILHYSPDSRSNFKKMTPIVTDYQKHFPPEFSSYSLLPYFLFSKVTSFNLMNPTVTYEKSSTGKDLIVLKGNDNTIQKIIYLDSQYNFAIIKEVITVPYLKIERIYDKYELINGFYLPTKVMQYTMSSAGNPTSIISAEFMNIRINDFINNDLLSNKLQEGEVVYDDRFGESMGFHYENSSTLTEDSIFRMAEEHNKQITKKMNNNISTGNSYWLYGGLLFFIGCIFIICQRLMRRK